jgi:vacuolar-type H+-ATPase subunit I/STV1
MSKKKAGINEFTTEEKVAILRDIDVMRNVSKVAEKWGVSRQSIYNWKAEREELDKQIVVEQQVRQVREESYFDRDVLKDLNQYRNTLQFLGTLEERKEKLSAKVEFMLIKITTLLERHPDLDEIHPKDLSKIMKDLHDVRKELSNEPAIIIEYKNKIKEQTLQVLQDFLDIDQLKEFASRMESIEADYEVLS